MIFRKIAAVVVLFLSLCATASAQFSEQRVWAGTSGGSANAQTLSVANMSEYMIGVPVRFIAGATNTGATTLNINSLGNKNVFKPTAAGAVVMTGGEIIIGQLVEVVYDGTQFQITANNTQSAAVRTSPQGYLTPCDTSAGSPVSGCSAGIAFPTGDVSAATALYYVPDAGNQMPIYNGSNMIQTAFGVLSLTIPSSRLANTIYDVCVFSNSGAPTAVFGPAWSTSTAGSGARGTGAGTAQIAQVQGVWVNAVQISAVNGGSNYTVSANQCTIVATVLIDGTNGQVSFLQSYGQSRKWAVYNFYNQRPLVLQAGDSTGSWSYNTATWRASRGDANNKITLLTGLPEITNLSFLQTLGTGATAGGPTEQNIGIGWNVTNSPSGTTGQARIGSSTSVNVNTRSSPLALYATAPVLGQNVATSIENTTSAGNDATYYGGIGSMVLVARWKG